MRTYISIGYLIIALQCIHICASTNRNILFNDEGSGGDEILVNNKIESNSVWADDEEMDEEESGSGFTPHHIDMDDDTEDKDDYYNYNDESSGVYPIIPPKNVPPFGENNNVEHYPVTNEDDFHIVPELYPSHNLDEVKPINAPDKSNPSFEFSATEKALPSTTAPPPLTDKDPEMENNNIRILVEEERQVSIFAQPSILAAFIGGAVMGLLCAILLVMFIVYRLRKRDEGSYPLDEPKRVPLTSSYAPNDKEIYA